MPSIRRFAASTLPLWLAFALIGCKSPVARGEPGELLAKGKAAMEKKDYREASRNFRGASVQKEAPEAEEATYLLARARQKRGRGTRSFETYKSFANDYPNSRYSVGAAQGEYDLGREIIDGKAPGFFIFKVERAYGLRVLQHMQVRYRNHSLADDALVHSADYLTKKGEYDESAEILRRLLSEYPRSEHMLWGRFQLARTLWLLSQGPDYDERILAQSKQAFGDYIASAKRLGADDAQADQVKEATEMMARIDARLAEKEYRVGRFYERTKRPDSAVYYYNRCVTSFPDSEGAKKSRERLAKLRPSEAS